MAKAKRKTPGHSDNVIMTKGEVEAHVHPGAVEQMKAQGYEVKPGQDAEKRRQKRVEEAAAAKAKPAEKAEAGQAAAE